MRLPEQVQQPPAAAGRPREAPLGRRGSRGAHHVAAGRAAAAWLAIVFQAKATEGRAVLGAAVARPVRSCTPAALRLPGAACPQPGHRLVPPPVSPTGRASPRPPGLRVPPQLGRQGGACLFLVGKQREALETCRQTNPRCCQSGEDAAAGRGGAVGFMTDCGGVKNVSAKT